MQAIPPEDSRARHSHVTQNKFMVCILQKLFFMKLSTSLYENSLTSFPSMYWPGRGILLSCTQLNGPCASAAARPNLDNLILCLLQSLWGREVQNVYFIWPVPSGNRLVLTTRLLLTKVDASMQFLLYRSTHAGETSSRVWSTCLLSL